MNPEIAFYKIIGTKPELKLENVEEPNWANELKELSRHQRRRWNTAMYLLLMSVHCCFVETSQCCKM